MATILASIIIVSVCFCIGFVAGAAWRELHSGGD